MNVRGVGRRGALVLAGVLALAGCSSLVVPDGEGEPPPTPTVRAHTATPPPPAASMGVQERPPGSREAPEERRAGACLSGSGPEVSMGEVEAALGHRAVGLTLTNCGKEPHQVYGYPSVQALGADGEVLDIIVNRGSSYMGEDKGPVSVFLAPGESVRSLLSWTSNKKGGEIRQGDAVLLAPSSGGKARKFPLEDEMRMLGEFTVTAWRPAP
ncbi:MAG TPA: DUF4232 domain-containing protein [Streptomyces sp.]|nr:DUF4232 domain-containing protein [Streptomyces sp.]